MLNGRKEAIRVEKYKSLCGANDLTYLDIDEFGVKSLLAPFELFQNRGKIRNLSHRKSPSMESEISVFDYKYKVSTGKSTVTFDQTIFFINSKQLGLPEFRMKPEHIGHKIAAYFGWDDIDFEQYPAFSDNYHLMGEHEEYIRHTFNDQILKYFSKTSGWTIEAANYYLIFYSFDSLVPDNILNDFYRLGMGIYDMFKLKD